MTSDPVNIHQQSDASLHDAIEQWLLSTRATRRPVNRPFVTLSYAQSLDGSIARQPGEPLALSGPQALRLTHHLRSLHDGILVGIGTILSDDPQLTVRHWAGKNPRPIVLDSHLRMPKQAKVCNNREHACWVITNQPSEKISQTSGRMADASRRMEEDARQMEEESAENSGVEFISVKAAQDGRVCLHHTLERLYEQGIEHVMVEGGAEVITAFLKAQLVDAMVVTVAPALIGGYRVIAQTNSELLAAPSINPCHSAPLGKDLIIWGTVGYATEQHAAINCAGNGL